MRGTARASALLVTCLLGAVAACSGSDPEPPAGAAARPTADGPVAPDGGGGPVADPGGVAQNACTAPTATASSTRVRAGEQVTVTIADYSEGCPDSFANGTPNETRTVPDDAAVQLTVAATTTDLGRVDVTPDGNAEVVVTIPATTPAGEAVVSIAGASVTITVVP